jgi:N-acetyl-1-D-myo-inositol-2-amino-2-deoxy-alpha-D-glucopyranoside deacetylase
MTKPRTLIFFGAHPDDESFGLGGTLAKYAAEGVKVVYACATRGEVGSVDPEHLKGFATTGDMRWAELMCAAKELGLADVIHLGYRDSGMAGSSDNQHPNALAAAPLNEVSAKVEAVMRDLKPEVVITFDPIGGYRHPDHIAIHQATVQAFNAVRASSPTDAPRKLYYAVFPRALLKLAVRIMPLLGRDPRRFGRNKDIDIASLAEVSFPVHAVINVTGEPLAAKERASACHKSQIASGPPARGLLSLFLRSSQNQEAFMRAYPPVMGSLREKDLFAGVEE